MRAAILGLVLLAAPASAAGIDIAEGLADILAAESFCGLAYDQVAIAAFVTANVAADDLDFTGNLKGLTYMAERAQQTMSASAVTAHCAQVRRIAETYGFITP